MKVNNDQIIFVLLPIYTIVPELFIIIHTQIYYDNYWSKRICLPESNVEEDSFIIDIPNEESFTIIPNEKYEYLSESIVASLYALDYNELKLDKNESFELKLSITQVNQNYN